MFGRHTGVFDVYRRGHLYVLWLGWVYYTGDDMCDLWQCHSRVHQLLDHDRMRSLQHHRAVLTVGLELHLRSRLRAVWLLLPNLLGGHAQLPDLLLGHRLHHLRHLLLRKLNLPVFPLLECDAGLPTVQLLNHLHTMRLSKQILPIRDDLCMRRWVRIKWEWLRDL